MTAKSPSVAGWQLELAQKIAKEIGVDHKIVETSETLNPNYIRNDSDRCFFCKQTLYQTLKSIPQHTSDYVVVSGTNVDDLGDHRPGIQAGGRASVQTPLADLGIGKEQVRELARQFGLSNAELPASPCLASRIAYGVAVTPDRLLMVESAESFLREFGFSDLRVRLHESDLGRIEVPPEEVGRLLDSDLRRQIDQEFRTLGFRYVTIDAQGLCSGSMNRPLVSITRGLN